MTNLEINDMIAEKVMGWRKLKMPGRNMLGKIIYEQTWNDRQGFVMYAAPDPRLMDEWDVWNPVENPSHALIILDKFKTYSPITLQYRGDNWFCSFYLDTISGAGDGTICGFCRAICEAALRAVGAWEEDE